MEAPVNAISEVPEPHRGLLTAVLREKNPDLLAALLVSVAPTLQQRDEVAGTMYEALSEHFLPGHEPDETGKAIDDALGAFVNRWIDVGPDDSPGPRS